MKLLFDQAVPLVSGAVGGLVLSIIANAVWDWVKDSLSYRSSRFPNMRGDWVATGQFMSDPTRTFEDQIHIHQQFRRSFSGWFLSSRPDRTSGQTKQLFRAEFVDRYVARYRYINATDTFSEVGGGVIRVAPDHETALGAAGNCGISSEEPTALTFKMTRVSRAH